jgi:hypothetical protein
VIADPPLLAGAENDTEIDPLPGVAVPIPGVAGGVLYVNAEGLESEPLLPGISVTGPTVAGMIVKVCGVEELLKVSTIGVLRPPPDGVMVTVPV